MSKELIFKPTSIPLDNKPINMSNAKIVKKTRDMVRELNKEAEARYVKAKLPKAKVKFYCESCKELQLINAELNKTIQDMKDKWNDVVRENRELKKRLQHPKTIIGILDLKEEN